MTKIAKLDVRKSRKLTSRECAAVIGGFLGGMATSNLIGVDVARAAVGLWSEGEAAEVLWSMLRHQRDNGSGATADAVVEAREWQADGADEAHRVFWRGLGAAISGCRTLASERSVRTACTWLFQQNGFWPKEEKPEEATAADDLVSDEGIRQPAPPQGDAVEPEGVEA